MKSTTAERLRSARRMQIDTETLRVIEDMQAAIDRIHQDGQDEKLRWMEEGQRLRKFPFGGLFGALALGLARRG